LKEAKSQEELAMLVVAAIDAVVTSKRVTDLSVEGHIRDGMGRNWDVSPAAPTPTHRKAIDSVRDRYDLA
jgi:hypothetical protein